MMHWWRCMYLATPLYVLAFAVCWSAEAFHASPSSLSVFSRLSSSASPTKSPSTKQNFHGRSAHNNDRLKLHVETTKISSRKNLWSVQDCLEEYQQNKDNVVFLDATWFHKGSRNGKAEYLEGPRLPAAHYWDLVDLSCSYDLFPEENPKNLFAMFPPEHLVAAALDWMNITPQTTCLVYAREGARFTPRVWYMLKKYCVPDQKIGLMQGSLEDWMAQRGPVDTHPLTESDHICRAKDLLARNESTRYPVSPKAREQLVDMDHVLGLLDKDESARPLILDTRGSSFAKKGHIPGAIHVPYSSLTEDDSTIRFKSKDVIADILLEKLGAERYLKLATEPVLLTCGSAVSVCHLSLLFEELGFPEPAIYDGSWNEWGNDPTTPKEM